MTWAEAMKVLDFAATRHLPVEVRAIDEDHTAWMVTVGKPERPQKSRGPEIRQIGDSGL